MAGVLARNILAMEETRKAEQAAIGRQERLAQAITRFTGSMAFVYIHVAIFGAWVLCNVGLVPGVPRFDRSFVILATVASVEAIFLSTFVLISQNRAAAADDRRARLDLQINLLAEHEITRLITLTAAMAERMGISSIEDPEIQELEQDVAPERILDEIVAREGEE